MDTPVEAQDLHTGVVKWFDVRRGFGFIVDDNGADVFVHFTMITGQSFRALRNGQRVAYGLRSGAKGLWAQDVRQMEVGGCHTAHRC